MTVTAVNICYQFHYITDTQSPQFILQIAAQNLSRLHFQLLHQLIIDCFSIIVWIKRFCHIHDSLHLSHIIFLQFICNRYCILAFNAFLYTFPISQVSDACANRSSLTCALKSSSAHLNFSSKVAILSLFYSSSDFFIER